MPIQDITYKIEQESGVQTQDNKRFDKTARLIYQATSNSPATDNTYIIGNDAAAPRIGYPHPFIPGLVSNGVVCRKVSTILYEFDVTFTGRGKEGESALDEPPVIEYDFAVSDEPYDQGYDGKPITFVTGEPPDPPLKDQQYDLIVRVKRNLRYIDIDLMSRYAGVTNSDYFLGMPPGTLKITEPPRATTATDSDGSTYYQCSIGITVRRGVPGLYEDDKAWWHRVLAQGYYVRTFVNSTSGATKIAHARIDGEKVSKPILHGKVSGFKIPFNDDGLQDPTRAEWYMFPPKKAPLPFSALNIA